MPLPRILVRQREAAHVVNVQFCRVGGSRQDAAKTALNPRHMGEVPRNGLVYERWEVAQYAPVHVVGVRSQNLVDFTILLQGDAADFRFRLRNVQHDVRRTGVERA